MGFLKREIQVQHGRILHRSHATSGYVGLSRLKKQKLEAAGSSGAVQALRMENDAPVVGPDAPTANSRMVKLDIATADWSRPTYGLRAFRRESCPPPVKFASWPLLSSFRRRNGNDSRALVTLTVGEAHAPKEEDRQRTQNHAPH